MQTGNRDVGFFFMLSAKIGESWKRFGSPAKILGRSVKVFEPYVIVFLNWTTCNLSDTTIMFVIFCVKKDEIGVLDNNKATNFVNP